MHSAAGEEATRVEERSRAPSAAVVVGIVAAWLGLLIVHVLLVFAFAGWLGTADDFIPWSIVAFLLLVWTRRRLENPPLWRSAGGRTVLAVWILLLVIAAAGVDEGRVPGIPAVPAAVVYSLIPVAATVGVVVAVGVRGIRQWRRLDVSRRPPGASPTTKGHRS